MLYAFHYADIPVKLKPHSRYPLRKFGLLRDGVIERGLVSKSGLVAADPAPDYEILRAIDRGYLEKVKHNKLSEKELREMGFLWSSGLYERGRRIVGCTLAATEAAKRFGVGVVLGGGAHHGHRDYGKGFCVFNDIAVSALSLLESTEDVAILDCDVHQGDGTAAILSKEPRAFTASVHARKNFPANKFPSDFDIELEDSCSDTEYVEACRTALLPCLERKFLIYVAGADPYSEDKLGRLKISRSALAERDQLVLNGCREKDIPVAIVFGGGYCEPIENTVEIYFQTIGVAKALFGF